MTQKGYLKEKVVKKKIYSEQKKKIYREQKKEIYVEAMIFVVGAAGVGNRMSW